MGALWPRSSCRATQSRESISPVASWRSCGSVISISPWLSISAVPSWQSREARCCSDRAGVSCICCEVHSSEAGEGYKELDCEGRHLSLAAFLLFKVEAYCKTPSEIYSSLGTATDVCLSTCTDLLTLLSCLFFYLTCTSSVNHSLFDVVCITRPACAHCRSGSGLLMCHSMIWHKLHWMLEVII